MPIDNPNHRFHRNHCHAEFSGDPLGPFCYQDVSAYSASRIWILLCILYTSIGDFPTLGFNAFPSGFLRTCPTTGA